VSYMAGRLFESTSNLALALLCLSKR